MPMATLQPADAAEPHEANMRTGRTGAAVPDRPHKDGQVGRLARRDRCGIRSGQPARHPCSRRGSKAAIPVDQRTGRREGRALLDTALCAARSRLRGGCRAIDGVARSSRRTRPGCDPRRGSPRSLCNRPGAALERRSPGRSGKRSARRGARDCPSCTGTGQSHSSSTFDWLNVVPSARSLTRVPGREAASRDLRSVAIGICCRSASADRRNPPCTRPEAPGGGPRSVRERAVVSAQVRAR